MQHPLEKKKTLTQIFSSVSAQSYESLMMPEEVFWQYKELYGFYNTAMLVSSLAIVTSSKWQGLHNDRQGTYSYLTHRKQISLSSMVVFPSTGIQEHKTHTIKMTALQILLEPYGTAL